MQCSVLLERLSSGVVHHERDDECDGVDVEAEGPDEEVSWTDWRTKALLHHTHS